LLETPEYYTKSYLIIDEGDTVLNREVNQKLSQANPKHILMLSAVPKEAWSGS